MPNSWYSAVCHRRRLLPQRRCSALDLEPGQDRCSGDQLRNAMHLEIVAPPVVVTFTQVSTFYFIFSVSCFVFIVNNVKFWSLFEIEVLFLDQWVVNCRITKIYILFLTFCILNPCMERICKLHVFHSQYFGSWFVFVHFDSQIGRQDSCV